MFRRHWRESAFWQWFWHERVNPEAKLLIGAVVIGLMLAGGWLAADRLSSASARVGSDGALTLETTVEKVTTVREHGRVVRKRVPVVRKVLVLKTTTDVRTSTAVRTRVVSKKVLTINGKTTTVVTATAPATTDTVTRTRTQTLTQVQAQTSTLTTTLTTTRTVTQPVTTTQTVITTQATTLPPVTVTVTQPILTVTL